MKLFTLELTDEEIIYLAEVLSYKIPHSRLTRSIEDKIRKLKV